MVPRAGWLVENPIHMDDKWGTPCMKTSLLKALLVSSLAAVHGSQMPRPSCLGQRLNVEEPGGADIGQWGGEKTRQFGDQTDQITWKLF